MLICMAVYDTEENDRTGLTRRTLEGLEKTVNFTRHRLIVTDNASCKATKDLLHHTRAHVFPFEVITLEENMGTAVAINAGWRDRLPGEHAVKMDNDVVIHEPDWPDMIELVFRKDPKIGICGLKRKDVWEWPLRNDAWKSEIYPLPHEAGERWLIVEEVGHVIGTCQAYNSSLLDRIGFLYQFQDKGNLYGFDDSLAAFRAKAAGFKSCFLPHIAIDHIDPGGNIYAEWKRQQASKFSALFHQYKDEYLSRRRDPYYGGP